MDISNLKLIGCDKGTLMHHENVGDKIEENITINNLFIYMQMNFLLDTYFNILMEKQQL